MKWLCTSLLVVALVLTGCAQPKPCPDCKPAPCACCVDGCRCAPACECCK